MKPILFSIAALILSLANTTVEIVNSNNIPSNDFTIIQDGVYLNQDLSITNEDIISSGCSSCHMEYTMDGTSLFNTLIENYNSKLLVHKESHPKYLSSLTNFIATHTEVEATAKYLDYQKVADYIEEY